MFRYRMILVLLLTTLPVAAALALPPPRPGIVDGVTGRFLTTGQRFPLIPKEVREYRRLSPMNGVYPVAPRSGAVTTAVVRPLVIDTARDASVRPLVFLIDFNDRPASAAPAIASGSVFAALYFGSGPRDLSVKNYWEEVSYTKQGTNLPGRSFHVFGTGADVVGWMRAGTDFPTSISQYSQIAGVQVANVRQLISDAVASLASGGFDFGPYVRPTDNTFQAVILHHPGYGQEDTGDTAFPYSHTAGIAPINPSNQPAYSIVDYTIVPSLQAPAGASLPDPAVDPAIGIGVIVHEMGHLFGLPDLYPTGGSGQVGGGFSGVGVYDLMGYGMWGTELLLRPDAPAHLSAWSKAELGWIVPQVRDASAFSLVLRPSEYYPDAHLVYPSSVDPTQWFLVENREKTDATAAAPPWLFDNFLPGAGILVWHVDNQVVAAARPSNTVNNDNVYKGLDLEEANGRNLLGRPFPVPPPPVTPNDRAPYFGQVSDYFRSTADEFSRGSPVPGVNETNSSPIVGLPAFVTGVRPPDALDNVTMGNFRAQGLRLPDGTISSSFIYDLVLSGPGGGAGAPGWKTFNILSTRRYPVDNTVPVPPGPMRSNDILSIAFDSGNNVWMGSKDQGIFRFLGTKFDFLGSSEGLPTLTPGSSIPLSPIRTMASEAATGSMWVGTDRGLFKMRNSGSGFRVQTSFTTSSPIPRTIPSNVIQAVAVRTGIDIKYAGTPLGLVRIVDRLTDSEADDGATVVLTTGDGNEGNGNGDVTALAIDDNGTPVADDDIVWAGFSNGIVARSRVSDPVRNADFRTYRLIGSPTLRVTALSIDKSGLLWIGTDRRGVEAFDLGETLGLANKRDPFDFDGDANLESEASLDRTRGLASDNVTGIATQAAEGSRQVVWFSHGRDLNLFQGGASRFDANSTNDGTTVTDERVTVFRPEAGVLPENQINGPSSTWLSTAAGDSAGNVWFGSTVQEAQGASRFGNAGVLSLDSTNYVNIDAVATVTLVDDGLNSDNTAVNRVRVFVVSAADPIGLILELAETGPDTGVLTGTFGFTLGTSDASGALPLLGVASGSAVTVTYFDANPRGARTANATWKKVFPFADSLFIDDFSCFIATAAYGSAMAPEVAMLRRFRDEFLLTSRAGSLFVSAYYRVSPPIAALVARSPVLKGAARFVLAPATGAAGFAVAARIWEKKAVAVILACAALALVIARRSRRIRPRR